MLHFSGLLSSVELLEEKAFPSSVLRLDHLRKLLITALPAIYMEKRLPIVLRLPTEMLELQQRQSLRPLQSNLEGLHYLANFLLEDRTADLGGQLLRASQELRQLWKTRLLCQC